MTERRIVISPSGAAIEWGRTALDSFSVPQHTRSSEINNQAFGSPSQSATLAPAANPLRREPSSCSQSSRVRAGERESNHFSVLYLAAGT